MGQWAKKGLFGAVAGQGAYHVGQWPNEGPLWFSACS
jgi:hypothetical protein